MGKNNTVENFKREYKQAMINCCTNFSERVCELYNYYQINLKAINNDYQQKKEKYSIAFKILDSFNSVYKCKTPEEQIAKFKEIKNNQICDNKKLKDLFAKIDFDEEEIGFSYVFKPEIRNFKDFLPSKARKINKIYLYSISRLKTSILSSLVSTYESFLSSVYSNLIYNNRSLYFGSRTITLQELISNDLDDIIEKQIDEIVESDMYDSIDLTKTIFEKEKIAQNEIAKTIEEFIEICSRRNIYIHNDGNVNKLYLSAVPSCNAKVGTYLKCDDKYYINSIISIQKLMFFMTFRLLEKEKMDDDVIEQILDFYFEKLANKEYEITEFVYRVLSSSKKLDFASKMICEVNYLISLKYLHKEKEFNDEISTFDVSASEKPFKIAKLILLNKFQEASKLIEESYDSEKTPNELLNWPLYQDFRCTDFYKEIVKNHSKDFAFEELSGDDSGLL